MTRVILVRHGQTIWNKELKYQGHSDIALTETGIRQAELVAARLAREEISAVYTSDLSRARVTAETIACRFGLPVNIDAALREIKFGDWEGLTYENINAGWPEANRKFFTNPDEVRIPGGETFAEVKERASAAIEKLVARHPQETIVVVTHGGTIRTIICAALNIHLKYLWSIRQDNTAVNIIEYYAERSIVTLINDTHHLQLADYYRKPNTSQQPD